LKLSREFKTGVVFVGALALLIWGYNFMKGKDIFAGDETTFFSEYKNVQGLNTASKVTINGLQVGKVQKIIANPDKDKRGELIVSFSMTDPDFVFSKKSIARIYSDGLMGGKALAIVPFYEGEDAVSGDYLKGEIESDMFSSVGEKLNPLSIKVESMIEQADSLLYGLNHIIDEPTRNNLQSSIAKFNQSMLEFSEISKNINVMLDKNKESLEVTLTNAKEITTKFSTLTDTLNKELEEAQIANTVKELKATISGLNQVIANLEKGEGSAGKLLKDDQLYTNLTNASKELEELLREMKEHPKRFVHFSVFGKKDKKE